MLSSWSPQLSMEARTPDLLRVNLNYQPCGPYLICKVCMMSQLEKKGAIKFQAYNTEFVMFSKAKMSTLLGGEGV